MATTPDMPTWFSVAANVATVVSTIVALVGFAVAASQRSKRKTVEEILRLRSWKNFYRADNANDTAQLALDSYKKLHHGAIHPELLELLARADGLSLEIVSDAVDAIQMSEPPLTHQVIAKWQEDGKLSKNAVALLKRLLRR